MLAKPQAWQVGIKCPNRTRLTLAKAHSHTVQQILCQRPAQDPIRVGSNHAGFAQFVCISPGVDSPMQFLSR